MNSNQSTAVLLTPPGAAAIAVVRVSGPVAGEFIRRHLSKPLMPGRCAHRELRDADRVLDDIVAVCVGPDIFDLSLHGGPWVVRSVLDLCRRSGLEVMDAAELPLRGVLCDADTELDREVLAYLPMARTEAGIRALLAQPGAWQELRDRSARDPLGVQTDVDRKLVDQTLWYLLHPPTVAIVGAANVGKSTLANQLFAQERAITADMPGTTRDWVGELANIDGLPVTLVDTPGQRQTENPTERLAIEGSRAQIDRAELVLLVLDATRPFEGEQAALVNRFADALPVVNKCDRATVWSTKSLSAIRTVATTGAGVDDLRRAIVRRFCGADQVSLTRAYCWTDRQRDVLRRAAADPAAMVDP